MTVAIATDAPHDPIRWDAIHWPTVHDQVRRLQVRIAKAAGEGTLQQPGRFGGLSKMLEPYDGKLSRTVLRGEGGRKAPDLPGAAKEIETIEPKKVRRQIVDRIQRLSKDPRPPGCEKLSGHSNRNRVRQGAYRIVYSVDDDVLVVCVVKVGHRGTA